MFSKNFLIKKKKIISGQNVEIKEGHLYPSDFEEATAVMLSNAIKGLQPVTRVGDLLFSCKEEVRALVNKLNSVMGLQET